MPFGTTLRKESYQFSCLPVIPGNLLYFLGQCLCGEASHWLKSISVSWESSWFVINRKGGPGGPVPSVHWKGLWLIHSLHYTALQYLLKSVQLFMTECSRENTTKFWTAVNRREGSTFWILLLTPIIERHYATSFTHKIYSPCCKMNICSVRVSGLVGNSITVLEEDFFLSRCDFKILFFFIVSVDRLSTEFILCYFFFVSNNTHYNVVKETCRIIWEKSHKSLSWAIQREFNWSARERVTKNTVTPLLKDRSASPQ